MNRTSAALFVCCLLSIANTLESAEWTELLRNNNFKHKKRTYTPHWRRFRFDTQHRVINHKQQHFLEIQSMNSSAVGTFQYADIQQLINSSSSSYTQQALRFSITAKYISTQRQSSNNNNQQHKFGFRVDIDIRCTDGSYIYQQIPVFSSEDSDLEDNTWKTACLVIKSFQSIEYATVYLLLDSKKNKDKVWIKHVSLQHRTEEITNNNKDPTCDNVVLSPTYHKFNTYRKLNYAIRASDFSQQADIAIVTQLSVSRLDTLILTSKLWKGLISAAIYIQNQKEQQLVEKTIKSAGIQNIDIHYVYAGQAVTLAATSIESQYPINILRNVAMENTKTEFFLLLDIDFIPDISLYDDMGNFLEEYGNSIRKKNVYCVAVFEVNEGEKLPKTKEELLDMVDKNTSRPVQQLYAPEATHALDYTRWYRADTPYDIEYEPHFEPYIITHRSIFKYDERFKGYGWDKVSFFYEMTMSKEYQLRVMPDHFLVHMNHPTTWRDEHQPVIMVRVWQNWYDFVHETHLKYFNTTERINNYHAWKKEEDNMHFWDLDVSRNDQHSDIRGLFFVLAAVFLIVPLLKLRNEKAKA